MVAKYSRVWNKKLSFFTGAVFDIFFLHFLESFWKRRKSSLLDIRKTEKCKNLLIWRQNMRKREISKNWQFSQVRSHRKLHFLFLLESIWTRRKISLLDIRITEKYKNLLIGIVKILMYETRKKNSFFVGLQSLKTFLFFFFFFFFFFAKPLKMKENVTNWHQDN